MALWCRVQVGFLGENWTTSSSIMSKLPLLHMMMIFLIWSRFRCSDSITKLTSSRESFFIQFTFYSVRDTDRLYQIFDSYITSTYLVQHQKHYQHNMEVLDSARAKFCTVWHFIDSAIIRSKGVCDHEWVSNHLNSTLPLTVQSCITAHSRQTCKRIKQCQ